MAPSMKKSLPVALLLAAALVPAPGPAHPIAGATVFQGVGQRIEMTFGNDSYIEANTGFAGGPLVEVHDEDPYVFSGDTGYGGGDLGYSVQDTLVCALDENTSGWSLTVHPEAESATLTSTVPGCSGTIEFAGIGTPGVTVSPSAGTGPSGRDGAGAALAVTVTRRATANGSFAGAAVDHVDWAYIGYTRTISAGAGLAE